MGNCTKLLSPYASQTLHPPLHQRAAIGGRSPMVSVYSDKRAPCSRTEDVALGAIEAGDQVLKAILLALKFTGDKHV